MKKILVMNSLFLAFSLILSACANAAPTQDPGQAATEVAAQVEAQVATRVAQAMAAALEATQKAQPTSTPFIPTVGALPTLAPVNIPTVSSLPGVATSVGCNGALSGGENYPDGTSIYINTAFNKSWTIQNAGTCTWNANYKIKFVSGDAMSGPAFKLFGASVPPGGSITLTLPLKTPGAVGTTTGYWGLYDDKDVYFGRVWVTINSGTVTPTSGTVTPISAYFAVTGVTFALHSTNNCKIQATITANGAGTVTYTWRSSSDAVLFTDTMPFSEAGSLWVNSPALSPGTTGVKIYIQPNNQTWPATAITIPNPCT